MDAPSVVERADRARARLATVGLRVEPMAPERAPALVAFHGRLSRNTTRRRFFTPHPELTPIEVERFTRVDHHDREALIAVDGEDRLVAVARLDRLGPGSPTAEVAFVVEDAWQHHGVGAAMFEVLAGRAVELGVHTLVAETLADNRAMLTVFRNSGSPTTFRSEGATVHVRIELPVGRPAVAGGDDPVGDGA